MVPEPGNPQSYNRYSYVRNNPMNFTDPTGHREIGANENDLLSFEASPPSPTPIWTDPFLDELDWVQPPGYTERGVRLYQNTSGIHTGMDWGKFSESFTEDPIQFAVHAGCECIVQSITPPSTEHPYDPWRVDLASTADKYADFLLIYGHLAEIQVSVSQTIKPDTIVGYLEPTERHVHVEIRRRSDNAYVNPWPYLAPNLQNQVQGLLREDTFLPGGSMGYPRFGYYGVK